MCAFTPLSKMSCFMIEWLFILRLFAIELNHCLLPLPPSPPKPEILKLSYQLLEFFGGT